MNLHNRDFFVARVNCGYLRYKSSDGLLIIKEPTQELLYEAGEIYTELLEADGISQTQSELILFHYGIVSEEDELDWKTIPKELEDLKVGIYKNFDSNTAILRRDHRKKEERLAEISSIKHTWDQYTIEGIASFCKSYFLIENTTYKDGEPYNFENLNVYDVMLHYKKEYISDKVIRELSRMDPWISIYDNRKNSRIFELETIDQQRLLSYSKMYENIQENEKCPKKEIINDDLALDGWIISQRRDKEKEQFKNEIENRTTNEKIKNSQEVFIMPQSSVSGGDMKWTKKEIETIEELNDEQSKRIKKQRFKETEGKELDAMKLKDQKDKARMEYNAR